jgi:uncharacterized protein (TIGR03066 family)
MNALKLSAVAVAMCLVVSGARAEDTELGKMLVGKWEITKAPEGAPPVGTVVEFTKDGTVKVVGKKDDKEFKMEGKYKVETHQFMCTFKDGDKEKTILHKDVKITNKMMSFKTDDGGVVELKRKS